MPDMHDPDRSPLNPLPFVVWMLAGPVAAIELLLSLADRGIIGGGLGLRLGEPYVERIREAMLPHTFADDRPPALHLAALGDLGGAIGAALLFWLDARDRRAAATAGSPMAVAVDI